MYSSTTPLSRSAYLGNLLAVAVMAAAVLWLVTRLIGDGNYPMATMLSAILVFLCLVYLWPRWSPLRWLAVGLALAMLFTLYPIFYTFYIAFTNMGDGHLLSKPQAVERLQAERYLPEGGTTYSWAAYRSAEGDFALWLIAGDGLTYLAKVGEPVTAASPDNLALAEDGFPQEVEGYRRLTNRETVPIISELGALEFGTGDNTIRIRSLREAATLIPRYHYDAGQDVMVDQQSGTVYSPIDGTFTSAAGERLTPGYMVTVGWRNFLRFLSNEAIRGPIVGILSWNFTFALLSVLLSFIVGLAIALLFEDLPGKQVIRALLIIPYPIPVLVSVLIWRSILNPDLGIISIALESLFGAAPAWFLDPTWARTALVLINVWLSYPYFYVITAGALGAIPLEIKQAATVDGASGWQSFAQIILPLLLRILGPLLIASFTFNFNNFNLVYIFNFGGPPLPNTIIPVGHTDILISFVYKLAFITSSTTNYGLAAAISIVLFIFVGLITILQIRFSNAFQEA